MLERRKVWVDYLKIMGVDGASFYVFRHATLPQRAIYGNIRLPTHPLVHLLTISALNFAFRVYYVEAVARWNQNGRGRRKRGER
jgi:hypothetical protein